MVNIGGNEYAVKALTVRQAREVYKHEDQSELEVQALALSTGAPVDDVAAWADTVPAGVFLKAVNEMWSVTNVTEEARFPNGPGNDAGDERAGV